MPQLWTFSDLHQGLGRHRLAPDAHARDFDTVIVGGEVHCPLTQSIGLLADRLAGALMTTHGVRAVEHSRPLPKECPDKALFAGCVVLADCTGVWCGGAG